MLASSITVSIIGLLFIIGYILYQYFSDPFDRIWGGIKDTGYSISATVQTPEVTLGPLGGQYEIDLCQNGVFIEVDAYKVDSGVQDIFAAHNGCGGDIILNWDLDQEVIVTDADGSSTRYFVSDSRVTPQVGIETTALHGMEGSILLQACFWGSGEMRFVALTPVGEEPMTMEEQDSHSVQIDNFEQ